MRTASPRLPPVLSCPLSCAGPGTARPHPISLAPGCSRVPAPGPCHSAQGIAAAWFVRWVRRDARGDFGHEPRVTRRERAAECGADYLVSHTFDGPIARAATAELALVLQCSLAAGLGPHPGLDLWPPHRIAAIRAREIEPHDSPGLGLHFQAGDDA